MCNGNGRGGERLYRMNEGDSIRTKNVRKRGKGETSAGFTVKPASRPVIEKQHPRSNISQDAIVTFFLITGI